MMKLKEIEKYFGSHMCWRTDNYQKLVVLSCALGDNFYDYGEEPKEVLDLSNCPPELQNTILNDNRIIICECCECCGCAGW